MKDPNKAGKGLIVKKVAQKVGGKYKSLEKAKYKSPDQKGKAVLNPPWGELTEEYGPPLVTVKSGKVLFSDHLTGLLAKVGHLITDDDPALVLGWNIDRISCFDVYNGQQVDPDVDEPDYLDMQSPQHFANSIAEHLRAVSGGRFGPVIGPNTIQEFSNVMTVLSHIEAEPFMQELAGHVDGPLAMLFVIASAAPARVNRVAPAHGVQVFE